MLQKRFCTIFIQSIYYKIDFALDMHSFARSQFIWFFAKKDFVVDLLNRFFAKTILHYLYSSHLLQNWFCTTYAFIRSFFYKSDFAINAREFSAKNPLQKQFCSKRACIFCTNSIAKVVFFSRSSQISLLVFPVVINRHAGTTPSSFRISPPPPPPVLSLPPKNPNPTPSPSFTYALQCPHFLYHRLYIYNRLYVCVYIYGNYYWLYDIKLWFTALCFYLFCRCSGCTHELNLHRPLILHQVTSFLNNFGLAKVIGAPASG